jgi:hypothetical protein
MSYDEGESRDEGRMGSPASRQNKPVIPGQRLRSTSDPVRPCAAGAHSDAEVGNLLEIHFYPSFFEGMRLGFEMPER